MKFPKPEQGVDRYEVWSHSSGCPSRPTCYACLQWDLSECSRLIKDARRAVGDETEDDNWAYIYDRRTGTVIETNEEALKKALKKADSCG